jgi:hypothetical protein
VNLPSPAIVSQEAVRSLPRWALWLLCIAYVIPGFIGRDPWKNADVAAFGYMLEIAQGHTDWLHPLLAGIAPEADGLLAYWLGALAIQIFSPWLASPEIAARLPFVGLLSLTLSSTWYTTYYLARSRHAQPITFAFGGEAHPRDYARALADGGLLALVACLGLAQLSHEITSYLAQLTCVSIVFFAISSAPYRPKTASMAFAIGLPALALSGAPTIGLMLSLGCILWLLTAKPITPFSLWRWCLGLTAISLVSLWLAHYCDLLTWRITFEVESQNWKSLARLLLWFGWPAWPMAIWTLWRWRRQTIAPRQYPHLSIPVWFMGVSLIATLTTQPSDRALLLGLPAMAVLAAFSLPTLSRSLSALIDWFTVIFFSVSAITIWVIWFAMQTGFPAKPAANVAKLAPEFVPHFSLLTLFIATAATVAWICLVLWRSKQNRVVIWKSVVLPAGGTVLSWLLLMTLWMPLLNYARSYSPQVTKIQNVIGITNECIHTDGLNQAQLAALRFHTNWLLLGKPEKPKCRWLLTNQTQWNINYKRTETNEQSVTEKEWEWVAAISRPTDSTEYIFILHRTINSDQKKFSKTLISSNKITD